MKGWPSAQVLSASRKPLSGRALWFLQRPLWPRSDSPRGVEEAQLLGFLLLDRCPHIWWHLLGTGPCLVAMPAVGLTGAPAPPVHLALSFRGAACHSCRPRVQAGLLSWNVDLELRANGKLLKFKQIFFFFQNRSKKSCFKSEQSGFKGAPGDGSHKASARGGTRARALGPRAGARRGQFLWARVSWEPSGEPRGHVWAH